MPQEDHIYRVIEIAGTSDKSIEDAVATAIGRANQTIRNLRWFEVVQTRGHIEDGKIAHFRDAESRIYHGVSALKERYSEPARLG